MYSLVDVILLVALLVTSVSAFMMHRKLSRLQEYHDRYEALLRQTGDALDSASAAVASFTSPKGNVSDRQSEIRHAAARRTVRTCSRPASRFARISVWRERPGTRRWIR